MCLCYYASREPQKSKGGEQMKEDTEPKALDATEFVRYALERARKPDESEDEWLKRMWEKKKTKAGITL